MNKNMTRVLCQSMITWDRAHPQYLPEINTTCPGPVFRLFGKHREPHCGYMLFRRHDEYQVSAEMHDRMKKVRRYNNYWSS
jgi:hypothetical protein